MTLDECMKNSHKGTALSGVVCYRCHKPFEYWETYHLTNGYFGCPDCYVGEPLGIDPDAKQVLKDDQEE